MKRKILIVVSAFMIAALSACGPAPAPTLSVDDIRSTAVAKVAGDLALTQAAIPTATETLIPPTAIELPTLAPQPTLPLVLPTAIVQASPTAACNQVPPQKPQGALAKVHFINKSGGLASLSFGMNTPNDQGECVTYSYSLNIYYDSEVTVLAGCYWGYAWISGGKKQSTAQTVQLLCLTDPVNAPAVWITPETINFH